MKKKKKKEKKRKRKIGYELQDGLDWTGLDWSQLVCWLY